MSNDPQPTTEQLRAMQAIIDRYEAALIQYANSINWMTHTDQAEDNLRRVWIGSGDGREYARRALCPPTEIEDEPCPTCGAVKVCDCGCAETWEREADATDATAHLYDGGLLMESARVSLGAGWNRCLHPIGQWDGAIGSACAACGTIPRPVAPPPPRCAECGCAISEPGLCGECGCEDDSDIW